MLARDLGLRFARCFPVGQASSPLGFATSGKGAYSMSHFFHVSTVNNTREHDQNIRISIRWSFEGVKQTRRLGVTGRVQTKMASRQKRSAFTYSYSKATSDGEIWNEKDLDESWKWVIEAENGIHIAILQ